MNESISKNLKRLRKERSLTQEQLAEALGVTTGAVYKWESGRSLPDLPMLLRLADLFGLSLDALVGYGVQHGGVTALEERINALQREKKYDAAADEAEKALLRFPNDFRIVYRAGELYAVAGLELSDPPKARRAIALLERAILLLSQNTDPKISEGSIQRTVAECYLLLNKIEKALEILKAHNVCGVHNPLIAFFYTQSDHPLQNAEPYLTDALDDLIPAAIRTMLAYANYYTRQKRYAPARDALLYLIGLLEGLKCDVEQVAYVDKLIAPCYSDCACTSWLLGEHERAESFLRQAAHVAHRYDAAPLCSIENLKFRIADRSNTTFYDDLGESAVAAVEKQLTQNDGNRELFALWKQILARERKEYRI